MQRLAAVLVAVLVAAVPVGAASAGSPAAAAGTHDAGAPTSDQPENGTANATNESVAPGERLAAVVSVQAAEIDGTVEERAFGIRVARAATNDSQAAVVADQLSEVEARLEAVERRQETLRERRANGTVSEGRFQAEMTVLSARAANLRRLANASERTARDLPEAALRRNGVNVTAIERLQRAAGNLTGPEVAAIARSIAGRDVGRPVGPVVRPGPATPGNRTPGGDAPSARQVRSALDAAETSVEELRETVNRTRAAAPGNGSAALDRAEANLTAAEEDLEAARTALEEGDAAAARDHLEAAREHLEAARKALEEARTGGGGDGGY